jgi:hypothetical protein
LQTATEEHGRIFRKAWIAGVLKHFPGEPKPGYITPWSDTPDWERQAAAAVDEQVRQFIDISGTTAKLTREQKGRFVAICLTGSSKQAPTSSSTSRTNTG